MFDFLTIPTDILSIWTGPTHHESSPRWLADPLTHFVAGTGKAGCLRNEPPPTSAITPTTTTCVCLDENHEYARSTPTCECPRQHKSPTLYISTPQLSSSVSLLARKWPSIWTTWVAVLTTSGRTFSDSWRWSSTERCLRSSSLTRIGWCVSGSSSSKSSVWITAVGLLS